jgi:ribosomal protein L34E
MSQNTLIPETVTAVEKYFYVFYGNAPSIMMARVAYRRTGKAEARPLHERKVLNCPYCAEPLTDIDKDTKVELYRYPARKKIRCQVYPVCPKCKNEVGMILIA